MSKKPYALSPENGFVFDTYTDLQNEFIKKIRTLGTDAANEWLVPVKNGTEVSYPRALTLRWECDAEPPYLLEISEDEEFTDPLSYQAAEKRYAVENLKTGQRYFWRVNGCEPHTFTTLPAAPRFLRVEGLMNVRDIGGGRVRQGLVYRGSVLDRHYFVPTEEGKRVFLEELKIKTELDLRQPTENREANPFEGRIRILPMPYRPYSEIFEEEHRRGICEIMNVFADEANYPIYIHCFGGADRTGMLAMYLEAIAGESDEYILTEYELTGLSMYMGGTKEGIAQGETAGLRSRNAEYFRPFLKLLGHYGASDATFAERLIAFLLDCGVTRETMDAVARIIKA